MREAFSYVLRFPISRIRRAWNYIHMAWRVGAHRVADSLRAVFSDLLRKLCASAVVFFAGVVFGYVLQKPASELSYLAAFSVLCGVTITELLAVLGRSEVERFHTYLRRLASPCRPDDDPYISRVKIRGGSNHERPNFLGEFLSIPASAPAALLVLKQTKKKWRNRRPYTFESMYAQLEARNGDKRASSIRIDWVCFVTKHFTVVAYQPFEVFENDILVNKNPRYADILCEPDPIEFRKRIQEQIDADKAQKTTKVTQQNVITHLKTTLLPDNLSKKQAMLELNKERKSECMLVSGDDKPLGMVTLTRLLSDTMAKNFASARELKDLQRLIDKWRSQSKAATEAIEAADIPSPPADTVDDSPELDALLRQAIALSVQHEPVTRP